MYLTDRPVGVLARSIAAVIPMGRWALEVRISTAVALPMDRWALEIKQIHRCCLTDGPMGMV